MKVKMLNVIESSDILQKLMTIEFKSNVAYKISRNARMLQPELDQFNNSKQDIIKKHAEKLEDGNFHIAKEKIQKVNRELHEILNEQIEVDIMKIDIDDLICDMSPSDIMKIEWMLNVEEEG